MLVKFKEVCIGNDVVAGCHVHQLKYLKIVKDYHPYSHDSEGPCHLVNTSPRQRPKRS
jgi:hypothetical protein